jgi:hypothetical protein
MPKKSQPAIPTIQNGQETEHTHDRVPRNWLGCHLKLGEREAETPLGA